MEFLKKHWKALLMGFIAIFNGIVGFLLFLGQSISYSLLVGVNFTMGVIYPLIELISNLTKRNEMVTATLAPKEKEDIDKIKSDVKMIKTEITQEKSKAKEKKKENRILIDLVNEGIISANTLDKNIIDKKFISVLCYQAGFKERSGFVSPEVILKGNEIRELNKKLKKENKPILEEIDLNREYSKMFEEVGFIRLAGRYPFFIIAQENIYPKKLSDLDKISKYLIEEGTIIVSEEWEKLKNAHKKHHPNFYEDKMKGKDNPVNLNMLIMKVNRRDMRHRFVLENHFNKDFNSELATIVKLNQFKTPKSEKIEVSKILSQSSLKILLLSLPEKERGKILELEEIFKSPREEGGLGIVNFYDYHYRNKEDIKNILKRKFKKEEKLDKYTDLIWDNSKDFKKDLEELGIKT